VALAESDKVVQDSSPIDSRRATFGNAVIATLILVTICHAFVHFYSEGSLSVKNVLAVLFLTLRTSSQPSYFLFWLLPAAWLFPCMITADSERISVRRSLYRSNLSLFISAGIAMVFVLWKASVITHSGTLPNPRAPDSAVIEQSIWIEWPGVVFMGVVMFLVAIGGILLSPNTGSVPVKLVPTVVAVLFGGLLLGAWFPITDGLRADAFLSWAGLLQSTGRSELAMIPYRRAIFLRPHEAVYRQAFARLLVPAAERSSKISTRRRFFDEAEQTLLPARTWFARESVYADLGDLYLRETALELAESGRSEMGRKAGDALALARRDTPPFEPLWTDSAFLHTVYLPDASAAAFENAKAETLIQQQGAYRWVGFYYDKASVVKSNLARHYALRGIELCNRAVKENSENMFECRLREAELFIIAADPTAGVTFSQQALEAAPIGQTWRAEAALAESYFALGDLPNAFAAVQSAISHAPLPNRPSLELLRTEIQKRGLR
jgi:tetratricopeptide (TPR) repeat protein